MNSYSVSQLAHLKTVELFNGLDNDKLVSIMEDSSREEYPADKLMFFQGDPAETFYVLAKGSIKLFQTTPEGDQVVLHYLKAGEAFGIIAVLREIDYPVTAQAVTDCVVYAWSHAIIKSWIFKEPQIAINSIRILSHHILEFQNRIRELATEKVEQRVARALLRLAQQSGKKTKNGVQINLKLTRQDIAEMTGTTMFSVSRMMHKWEKKGIINSSREFIVILIPHELVKVADDIPLE